MTRNRGASGKGTSILLPPEQTTTAHEAVCRAGLTHWRSQRSNGRSPLVEAVFGWQPPDALENPGAVGGGAAALSAEPDRLLLLLLTQPLPLLLPWLYGT